MKLGFGDEVIFEDLAETHNNFPVTKARIIAFVTRELSRFAAKKLLHSVTRSTAHWADFSRLRQKFASRDCKLPIFFGKGTPCRTEDLDALQVVQALGKRGYSWPAVSIPGIGASWFGHNSTSGADLSPALVVFVNAKFILGRDGPEAMAKWVRA